MANKKIEQLKNFDKTVSKHGLACGCGCNIDYYSSVKVSDLWKKPEHKVGSGYVPNKYLKLV